MCFNTSRASGLAAQEDLIALKDSIVSSSRRIWEGSMASASWNSDFASDFASDMESLLHHPSYADIEIVVWIVGLKLYPYYSFLYFKSQILRHP